MKEIQDRRSFIQGTCGALLALPFAGVTSGAEPRGNQAAPSVPADLAKRISVSTVSFRERFKSTQRGQANPSGEELTLLTAPKFIADKMSLHNVEVWSAHFDDPSIAYCKQIREAAAKVGSQIVNIELDGTYYLSSSDPAERAKSIEIVKGWMDRAKALGATRMRPNPQPANKASDPFDLKIAANSYRQLAAYGKQIGVKVVTKNHIGATLNIDTLVALIQEVNDPYCRLILDWGNSHFDSMEARLAAFRKAFPYMEMETAKGMFFDANNQPADDYDYGTLVRATEESGFKGLYSIELYSSKPPADTVMASKAVLAALVANMKRA